MKQLLVLFALIAVGSSSVWKGGLRVRFDTGILFGRTFFFDIPRTATDARDEGWTLQTPPDGLPVTSVNMFCYSDFVVCTFYDYFGEVAGLQVGLSKDQFTPHYDLGKTGFTDWTVNGRSFWTLQQYFTTEGANIQPQPSGRANQNKITENGGVWVVGLDKEVLFISNSTDTIRDEGVFLRHACIPWMGRHYYYKMDKDLSCDEPLYPWFALVESGELVATGLMAPGTLHLPAGERLWFETPNVSEVKTIITDGPQCVYDNVENYGHLAMHVYYIDQPWLISCIFQ